jgi:hypothetical protein
MFENRITAKDSGLLYTPVFISEQLEEEDVQE